MLILELEPERNPGGVWVVYVCEGRGLFNSCLSYYPRPLFTPARSIEQATNLYR